MHNLSLLDMDKTYLIASMEQVIGKLISGRSLTVSASRGNVPPTITRHSPDSGWKDGVENAVSADVAVALQAAVDSATSIGAAKEAGSALAAKNAADSDVALPVAPAATPPAQATHGETAAKGYYSWLLHNSNNVPVYYGDCTAYGEACDTGGSWNFSMNANTIYSATDGILWSDYITHRSGVSSELLDVSVTLYRDVTGSPDTDEGSLSCASYGSSHDCSGYSKRGNVTGHWYYWEFDCVNSPVGYPQSSFQVQTRRYENLGNSNWTFESFKYFGN